MIDQTWTHRLSVLAQIVRTVAALAAYAVSYLAPSREGLWVFAANGGNRFVGNPKYAFLHAANERDDIRAIWLSKNDDVVAMLRDAGYEAYHARSPRGLLHTLLSEYLFVSHGSADATWWVTGGTDVVQLWHGVPIKTVGDNLDRAWSLPGRFFFRLLGSNWAYHVVTGEAVGPVVHEAYKQTEESILPVGYPRNDVLRGEVPDAELGVDSHVLTTVRDLSRDHPVAFYMPTWREWSDGIDHGGVPLDDAIDFESLDASFAARDAYLLVKLHPRERLDVDLDQLDNVLELPADTDPYPLLEHVDVLVTDYSSIYVDYLLTDNPIVFYPYDLPIYESHPGFEFDYDAVTPGPTPTDFTDFQNALLDALDAEDEYADERTRVRERFIDHPEGSAAARLCRHLLHESPRARREPDDTGEVTEAVGVASE